MVLVCLVGFVMPILSSMRIIGSGLSWFLVLVSLGLVTGVFFRGALEYDVYSSPLFALLRWGVQPQLYADNLKCVSRNPDLLSAAARFTTGYVRLVGQEPAPSKCVLLDTSREIRYDMKSWVPSQEGDQWSVKFDVRDLGGHLDTTFRGWSSTLAAGVRLVLSKLFLIFALPLDFHGRVRVVRSMYLPAALPWYRSLSSCF